MATTTVEPKARKRRRKTRTRNISSLPAIIASELTASQIDLTPGKEHVICPACKCWTPITGVQGTPVLVPHHTTPYHDRITTPRRCSSSNRRITLNTELDTWRADLAERTEVSATVASRRPTKVLPKPKTTAALTPVYRLAGRGPQGTPALHRLLPLLERARHAVDQHRAACSLCRTGGRCDAGRALEIRLAETEASCTIAREQLKHEERPVQRTPRPSVRKAQWVKYGGETVEKSNNRCAPQLSGARSEFSGPQIPLAPQDQEAHDQRQTELGKHYARTATQSA